MLTNYRSLCDTTMNSDVTGNKKALKDENQLHLRFPGSIYTHGIHQASYTILLNSFMFSIVCGSQFVSDQPRLVDNCVSNY